MNRKFTDYATMPEMGTTCTVLSTRSPAFRSKSSPSAVGLRAFRCNQVH